MIDIDNLSDEMLAAYLDGNLSPEESAAIGSFVSADESLSELVGIMESGMEVMDLPGMEFNLQMMGVGSDWAAMPEGDVAGGLHFDPFDTLAADVAVAGEPDTTFGQDDITLSNDMIHLDDTTFTNDNLYDNITDF